MRREVHPSRFLIHSQDVHNRERTFREPSDDVAREIVEIEVIPAILFRRPYEPIATGKHVELRWPGPQRSKGRLRGLGEYDPRLAARCIGRDQVQVLVLAIQRHEEPFGAVGQPLNGH